MKRLLILFTCSLTYLGSVNAVEVSESKAIQKAKILMPTKKFLTDSDYRARRGLPTRQDLSKPRPFYIFNAEDDGFVIVAGDDRVSDILAYSEHGSLDLSTVPSNVKWWLDYYENAITSIMENGDELANSHILRSNIEERNEILPLITTTWGQSDPYNKSCPTLNGERCLTGCVATAMAQVMYYWKWPSEQTFPIDAYTTTSNYIIMPALNPTSFDWNNMDEDEIAKLMLYCGQSVKMDYGINASGAYNVDIPDAFIDYFDYDINTSIIFRETYTSSEWEDIIYEELQHGRPVIYCGQSDLGGHAFICCGYQEGKYYINWGWDGLYDGYFELSLLKPTNKESENFSSDQMAIIGLQATDGQQATETETSFVHPDLHLFVTVNKLTREATIANAAIDRPENGNSLVSPYDDEHNLDGTNYWEHLVIPETIQYDGKTYTITEIGPYAFNRTTLIKTVTLPESIRSIGQYAFNWCVNLESVNIPSHVKSIESHTFTYCRNLETIHLPDSIRTIGYGAFSDCKKLKEINIPGNCLKIEAEAFTWCNNLYKLVIEDGDSILNLSYSYDLGVDYEIGASWYTNPFLRGQFNDCPVKELYIGRNLSFPEETKTASFLPFQLLMWWGYYDDYGNAVVRSMGNQYHSLEFGEKVTDIPDKLFINSKIPTLTLPSNLKTIGKEAFSGIDNVIENQMELTIPETVETIGANAFRNSGLRYIRCNSNTPPELGAKYTFATDNSHDANMRGFHSIIYVPEGAGNTYRNTENWDYYIIIDPSDEVTTINVRTPGTLYSRLLAQDLQVNDVNRLLIKGTLNNDDWTILEQMKHCYDIDLSNLNTQEIPNKLFFENATLVNIKLPNSLKVISDSLFYSCEHLKDIIDIPASCTEIGVWAFYNTAVEGINYSGSIHIKNNAFRKNANLQELNVEGEGTIIDSWAFNDTPIKKITIGRGAVINEEAFFYNTQLKEIIFKDGVKLLGDHAITASSNLKKIVFEGTIEEIRTCPWGKVEEVHISDVGTWLNLPFPDIETNPLYQAEHFLLNGIEITDITIPENISNINDYAFYNCKSLKSISLHEGLTSIGNESFYGCSNIEEIYLPSTLRSIGESAFEGCSMISELDFSERISFIGDCAFKDCSNLTKVIAPWDNPFTITSTTFNGVASDCYLYIPIATATKYFNAGWNAIPNVKEAGIIMLKVNTGGNVIYNDETISNESKKLIFSPYRSFYLTLSSNDGYYIKKVKLNGENVTSQIEDEKLYIEEPEENMEISVVFADENIAMGDVNGDGVVDEEDAISVLNHIVKNSPITFYDYASDMNDDDVINVMDAILLVRRILCDNPSATVKDLKSLLNF